MITPISGLTEADWQQAESTGFSGTSQAFIGDLAIGAGDYQLARYTDETGNTHAGWIVNLYIRVPKDHYEDRVISVYAGKQFSVAGHAIRVVDVGYDSARIQVILPDEPLQADPRFTREKLAKAIYSETPRRLLLDKSSPYDLMILSVAPGTYVDVDGVEREGYVAEMQLLLDDQVIYTFVGHRGFEQTLPDGSYLRIFQLDLHSTFVGITPLPSATPPP